MIRLYYTLVIAAFISASSMSCNSKDSTPSHVKEQKLNEDGIPINFTSSFTPNLVHAIATNIPHLLNATKLAQKHNQLPPGVDLRCETLDDQETRCLLQYNSQEIKVRADDLFFGAVGGTLTVRKGCNKDSCDVPKAKVWWRTIKSELAGNENEYTLEVCNIEGVRLGLGFSGPLKAATSLLGKLINAPQLNGMKVKVESYQGIGPLFTEYGYPLLDELGTRIFGPKTKYKTTSVHMGLGPVGGFPNKNCALIENPSQSSRDESDFKVNAVEDYNGGLPSRTYEDISGASIRYATEITNYLGKDSNSELMSINASCTEQSRATNCSLTYEGPALSIPLPKYITGVFDARVELVRSCTNLGCSQQDNVDVELSVLKKGRLTVAEICKITGIEASNLNSFPFQERLLGKPDITGLKIALDPTGSKDGGPSFQEFRLGIGHFGKYPNNRCQDLNLFQSQI